MKLNLITEFKAHPRHAQSVAFSPDGREIATTGMDALAQVWSIPGFESVRTLRGHDKSVNAIALSPDGYYAATGSTDRAVIIWNWKSGDLLHRLSGHRNTVATVKFSPSGDIAASSSYDGRVGLWRRGSDSLEIFRSHPKHVTSLSFSKDGQSLAAAGVGNVVKVWDTESRELVKEIEAPGRVATHCIFLPNGNLCCITYEGEIAIYSGNSYDLISADSPSVGPVSSATCIFNSDTLLCSVNGGVILLDLSTMEIATRYETGVKGMYGVACAPNGTMTAAASADGRCRIWEVAR